MDTTSGSCPERRPAVVAQELERNNIDIAELSETRLPDDGQIKENGVGYTFYWKGLPASDRRIHGVGFAIKNSIVERLHELPLE